MSAPQWATGLISQEIPTAICAFSSALQAFLLYYSIVTSDQPDSHIFGREDCWPPCAARAAVAPALAAFWTASPRSVYYRHRGGLGKGIVKLVGLIFRWPRTRERPFSSPSVLCRGLSSARVRVLVGPFSARAADAKLPGAHIAPRRSATHVLRPADHSLLSEHASLKQRANLIGVASVR